MLSASARTVAAMTTTHDLPALAWTDVVDTVTAAGGGVFLATTGAEVKPETIAVLQELIKEDAH